MTFSEIVDAITAATDMPRGRVYMHGRRLQEVGVIPTDAGGRNAPECTAAHVVLILFSLLSGAPIHRAFSAALTYGQLQNDGTTALGYLINMLEQVAAVDPSAIKDITKLPEALFLAFKASVSIVAGEQPAIVVRFSCTDEPFETAFTVDGAPYEPERIETITESRTIPGIFLFKLGQALREVSR